MGNAQQYIGERMQIEGQIVECIAYMGSGGHSYIFTVKDIQTLKLYVLKRMVAENKEKQKEIEMEIRLMKQLKHPNIVKYVANEHVCTSRGREIFLLMELCQQHLLDHMLTKGDSRWNENELIRIFHQLCSPVTFMHSMNPPIAHRDLKLENYLIAFDGTIKLCDFGSAVQGERLLNTKEQIAMEKEEVEKHTTAMYRSPELADLEGNAMFGERKVNEKVDIWALGCILYTLAFFKSPFPPEGLRTDKYKIPFDSPYSNSFHTLIKKMLTADVQERASIDHVMECINALEHQQPFPKLKNSCIQHLNTNKKNNLDIKPSINSKSKPSPKLTTQAVADLLGDFNSISVSSSLNAEDFSHSLATTVDSTFPPLIPSTLDSFEMFLSSSSKNLSSSIKTTSKTVDEFGFPIHASTTKSWNPFDDLPVSTIIPSKTNSVSLSSQTDVVQRKASNAKPSSLDIFPFEM